MTEIGSRIKRFAENFGKVPDEPPAPLIPERFRMPVFLGMVFISLILLVALLWLVVLPAIHAQQSAPLHSAAPARAAHAIARGMRKETS